MLDKRALYIRRNKIEEMYTKGFQLIEIARYFEIPLRSVKKSLKISNFQFINEIQPRNVIFERELEKRNELIKKTCIESGDEAWLGFWRLPQEFKSEKDLDKQEYEIQKELRTIGILPNEICQYMCYADVTAVKVSKAQVNPFLLEQRNVAKKLKEGGWNEVDILEFVGISLRGLKKEIADDKLNINKTHDQCRVKYYDKIKEKAEKYYKLYESGKSHQEIAQENKTSRRTVITYISEYCLRNPDKKKIKRTSAGNKSKGRESMPDVMSELREKYLTVNHEGKLIFREYVDSSNIKKIYTIEKVAELIGVNEITIVKHKKKLEEEAK